MREPERVDRARAGNRTPDLFITSESLYQLSYPGTRRNARRTHKTRRKSPELLNIPINGGAKKGLESYSKAPN